MKNISLIAFYYTLKSNKTPLKLWIPLNTIDNKFSLCKIRGNKKAFKRNRQKMWGKGERRGKKGKRMEKRGNGKRQLKKCVWAMNKKNSIAECNGEMVTISRWIWNLFAHKKVHCYVIEADLLGLISEAGVFVLEIQHLSSIIYCIVRTNNFH